MLRWKVDCVLANVPCSRKMGRVEILEFCERCAWVLSNTINLNKNMIILKYCTAQLPTDNPWKWYNCVLPCFWRWTSCSFLLVPPLLRMLAMRKTTLTAVNARRKERNQRPISHRRCPVIYHLRQLWLVEVFIRLSHRALSSICAPFFHSTALFDRRYTTHYCHWCCTSTTRDEEMMHYSGLLNLPTILTITLKRPTKSCIMHFALVTSLLSSIRLPRRKVTTSYLQVYIIIWHSSRKLWNLLSSNNKVASIMLARLVVPRVGHLRYIHSTRWVFVVTTKAKYPLLNSFVINPRTERTVTFIASSFATSHTRCTRWPIAVCTR